MIIRGIVVIAIAGISLYSSGIIPDFNSKEKEVAIVQTVLQTLDQVHFDPKEIDDEFSENMFDTYVDMLDGNKRFFTQDDIDQLSAHRDRIDDEIKYNKMDFFNLSLDLLNASINKTKVYYADILAKPFDFTISESLEMDGEKRDYAKDDNELKELWRRTLKYEVLNRFVSEIEENETAETPRTHEELELETREKVQKIYKDWYGRMDQLRRSDRFEVFMGALTHGFDPHSDYFSPKEKEDFDIRMRNRLEGIGARLQTDDDYTKVVSIIPGGPAWKGKELEVDDKIVQVAQDMEEFVDITGMRIDDVVQLIRGPKGTKVTLKVKKKDGSLEDIFIIRDEVIIEDGKAKSVIMNQTGGLDNVGFISLPSFYSDFSDKNRNGCADDIALEIEKLKEQNVNGIVLDLRYNGGGSLSEVVEMAGFFVEEGPIVQVKQKNSEPYVYKDNDGGSVKYDGPMVILVNSFSVSASEILAAALQDYKRAVIVGSKSTFGKGTVQRFWNLDQIIRGADDIKPLGEVKITTQKFFRINGGSTQLKGVNSDVVLPDAYHYVQTGEKDLENAMQWTKVEKREFNQSTYFINDLPEIAKRSGQRLKQDTEFGLVNQQATVLKKFKDNTVIPLNLQDYILMNERRENIDDEFKTAFNKEITGLEILNLPQDIPFIQKDSSRIARNEEWMKLLRKDIYAEEAIYVLKDIIELK